MEEVPPHVEAVIETAPVADEPVVAAPAPVEAKLKLFDQAYAKLKELVGAREFNAGNWFALLPLAMTLVETSKTLTGSEKKALVIDLLSKLVCEIPMSDGDRAIVKSVISTALPLMIDTIVASSLGELAINILDEVEERASLCFMRCKAKHPAPKSRRARK